MKDSKNLKVNFDDIQKAMEDVTRDTFDYFLDTDTGEVISISEEIMKEIACRLYDTDFEDMDEDIEYIEFDEEPDLPDWMFDEIDLALEVFLNKDGQYVHVPERKASIAYQTMADFSKTVSDLIIREELNHALNGKGAFRKFKDILINYPKERKQWHGHNAKAMKREIREWLNSIGIKPIY